MGKETPKVKWRKIGGGILRLGNRVIKPNQVFSASPDEIPESFATFVERVEFVRRKPDVPAEAKKEADTPATIPEE